jgi:hypothetical protein
LLSARLVFISRFLANEYGHKRIGMLDRKWGVSLLFKSTMTASDLVVTDADSSH